MAKNLPEWILKETQNKNVLSLILNFLFSLPLVLMVLYIIFSFYKFMYPPPKNNTTNSTSPINSESIKEKIISYIFKFFKMLSKPFKAILNFFCHIWSFICWIFRNPFRTLSLVLLVVFIVVFFYFRKLYGYSGVLNSYSPYINGIFIVFGILLTIFVFTLFIGKKGSVKVDEKPQDYPKDASFLLKFCWAFYNAIGYYKELGFILIATLVPLLILFFISSFQSLSSPVSIILLIISFLFLIKLFIQVYCIFNNSKKSTDKKEQFEKDNTKDESFSSKSFYFFYNKIASLKQFFLNLIYSFCETNYYIRVLLLIQIIGIVLYLVIPILIKYIYTHNVKKTGEILNTQKYFGMDLAIIENNKKIKEIKSKLFVDWGKIMSKGLYRNEKVNELTAYLEKIGYIKKNEQQNKLLTKMFGRSMTLEAAITYIQTNTPVIINLTNKIAYQKKTKSNTVNNKNNNIESTKVLLNKPIYTDIEKSIATYKDIGNDTGSFNYNYSISAWFFIHNEPPNLKYANNKFTSILNYAERPNVMFNVSTNTLRLTSIDNFDKKSTIFETDKIRLQRWNNIIINVVSGTYDIFLNGKLVSSSNSHVPFMSYDNITTGEENGISGGVCNVTYYPAPLTLPKIKLLYKSLKWKSPPII